MFNSTVTAAAPRYPPTSTPSGDAPSISCTDLTSKMHGDQHFHGSRRNQMTDPYYAARNFTPINNTSASNSLPSSTRASAAAVPQHERQQHRYARGEAQQSYTSREYEQGYYNNARADGYDRSWYGQPSENYGGYGYSQGQAQAQAQQENLWSYGQHYSQYSQGYERGHQYSAYPQTQYAQQDPSWSNWQPNSSYHSTAPAQQAGYAYSLPWYASAQPASAGFAPLSTWPGPGIYSSQQHLLTSPEDDNNSMTNVYAPASRIEQVSESVITESLIKRIKINNKRRSTTVEPTHSAARRRQKQLLEKVATLMSDVPAATPPQHISIPKRPNPSQNYLQTASQPPHPLDSPRPLLVILDLNGTLLFRKSRGGGSFVPRPHLNTFLDYIFSNHIVMVWSSARPENVAKMCSNLFTKEQQSQLVAVWARDKLKLSTTAYKEKVQVYKQLNWVWKDRSIGGKSLWSQANTVLIDDSTEKAASEPHNLIQIDEFEAKPEQMSMDVLGQVTTYLMQLAWQSDVSAFIRAHPFQYVAQDNANSKDGQLSGQSEHGSNQMGLQKDW